MNQKIEAVIFDWAGTTIDYGCFAPLKGFIDGFSSKNVEITVEEARAPMGMLKMEHTRAIAAMPRIQEVFLEKNNREIEETDILDIYHAFENTLTGNLLDYTDIKPGVLDAVSWLQSRGIKIGSTSGYTRSMMNMITEKVAQKGYRPEVCVCADEVPKGRPFPYMIWENMIKLEVSNPRHIVKVGDTVADIKEGLSANVWSVGVILGSSELGLTKEQAEAMPKEQLEQEICRVRARFYEAGADRIILDMSELPAAIEWIEAALMKQEEYKLLTPGPLTTRSSVKQALLADHCTWDEDYKAITRSVLEDITNISANIEEYATVLLQGSGSYAVEAMIQCFCKKDEKLLILENGAYGKRMVKQAQMADKSYVTLSFDMCSAISVEAVEEYLIKEPDIQTVMFVHSETTSGIINPIKELAQIAKAYGKRVLVDAMSSFGAYEIQMKEWGIDALASSANKCLEGLPGLSFVIAKKSLLNEKESPSKSLCLDILDQYKGLYEGGGKFRFTSPTNILLALRRALDMYQMEGGQAVRLARYHKNHETLMLGMEKLGIQAIISPKWQSDIITTFYLGEIDFNQMYTFLKNHGFVIYPGKLTKIPTFRIGTIGDIFPSDMERLCDVLYRYLQTLSGTKKL